MWSMNLSYVLISEGRWVLGRPKKWQENVFLSYFGCILITTIELKDFVNATMNYFSTYFLTVLLETRKDKVS